MQAKLRQHGEISIVQIQGSLQIERTQAFREACSKSFIGKKIIFNMEEAHFVGSTGIQSFIDAVKILTANGESKLKLVGLKAEFKRIFANLELVGVEILETESVAIESFTVGGLPSISG
jgi:anti-anti-sigma factor